MSSCHWEIKNSIRLFYLAGHAGDQADKIFNFLW